MMTSFTFSKTKKVNENLLQEEAKTSLDGRLGCLSLTSTTIRFDVEDEQAGDETILQAIVDAHDASQESAEQAADKKRKASKAEVNATDFDTMQKAAKTAKDLTEIKAVVSNVILAVARLAEAEGMTPTTPATITP